MTAMKQKKVISLNCTYAESAILLSCFFIARDPSYGMRGVLQLIKSIYKFESL